MSTAMPELRRRVHWHRTRRPPLEHNQLWGLAWGALVFREFYGRSDAAMWLVLVGSVTMVLGAGAISTAAASGKEQASTQ